MIRCTTVPVIIKPPVYELTLNFWNWCKLSDVCELVPQLAKLADVDFEPSPEELVSRFAALVRLNRIPDRVPQEKREERKKKIFRFSVDGSGFWGQEVPLTGLGAPPYVPFFLPLERPYPKTMFVPEGWAIDTLYAVRRGAIAAAEWGDDVRVGFPPRDSGRDLVNLGRKGARYFVKVPDCV